MTVISDAVMRRHLDEFLDGHGLTVSDIPSEVDRSLGEPVLVVASGSVLQGFGNPSSDVDLYAVVDRESITDFPMNTYRDGLHFDITFLKVSWLSGQLDALRTATKAGTLLVLPDRESWKAEHRRLTQLNRLALGLALSGRDEWRGWQAELRRLWPRQLTTWWKTEAVRYRTAATVLEDIHPLAAALRHGDAYLRALSALCAEAGELYFMDKWLGSKLCRLGWDDLVERFRAVMALPADARGAVEYSARIAGWYAEAIAAWDLPEPWLVLHPADGVREWRANRKLLVQRYGLRGVEFVAEHEKQATSYDLPWTGRLADLTDEHRTLIREGLVWLSVLEDRP
jgi:hypothetical protein